MLAFIKKVELPDLIYNNSCSGGWNYYHSSFMSKFVAKMQDPSIEDGQFNEFLILSETL